MRYMSKAKLDKDFEEFNLQIDKLAEEEIKGIRDEADTIRAEASKIGENVEASINRAKAT